jgi:hypothetical protein
LKLPGRIVLFVHGAGAVDEQQRQPAGEDSHHNLLKEGIAIPGNLASLLRFRLRLRQQHGQVFCEISPAFVALAPMSLLMLAGGTGKPQRVMTPHTEFDRLQIFLTAFAALHAEIILTSRSGRTIPDTN